MISERVSPREAVEYGISVTAYVFGSVVVTFLLLGAGSLMALSENVIGELVSILFVIVGLLFSICASYGLLYKLIADSVSRGKFSIEYIL